MVAWLSPPTPAISTPRYTPQILTNTSVRLPRRTRFSHPSAKHTGSRSPPSSPDSSITAADATSSTFIGSHPSPHPSDPSSFPAPSSSCCSSSIRRFRFFDNPFSLPPLPLPPASRGNSRCGSNVAAFFFSCSCGCFRLRRPGLLSPPLSLPAPPPPKWMEKGAEVWCCSGGRRGLVVVAMSRASLARGYRKPSCSAAASRRSTCRLRLVWIGWCKGLVSIQSIGRIDPQPLLACGSSRPFARCTRAASLLMFAVMSGGAKSWVRSSQPYGHPKQEMQAPFTPASLPPHRSRRLPHARAPRPAAPPAPPTWSRPLCIYIPIHKRRKAVSYDINKKT